MIKCLSPSVHHHHQYNRKYLNIADISVKSMRDLSIWSNFGQVSNDFGIEQFKY